MSDLTALDDVARLILARLRPVQFAIASTEQQRQETFRLRYRAVIDRGWASPADLPDGIEQDADDVRAVMVCGWSETKPIAAARLIFPDPEYRLPVESTFDITVEPAGRVVNVDRITVDRGHSDAESRLLLGLLACCWLEIRKRGFHIWTGTDSPGAIRLYRRLGFETTVLAPSRTYWGEERFPVRFDSASGVPNRHKLIGADS